MARFVNTGKIERSTAGPAFLVLALCGLFAVTGLRPASAQEADHEPGKTQAAAATQEKEAPVNPNAISSIFFTYWEYTALMDAKKARGNVRPPSDAELTRSMQGREEAVERIKPPPEKRYVFLSGIVYHSDEDWTIWLNGMRVTPEALPKEVVDMVVYREYVELKWLDDYTEQIFPIRIRPHQRFNLDTRIFLPG